MAADEPIVAVLAAGQARRFGGGKLDADCAGKPLGQWALDAVAKAGLPPGFIIVGPDAPSFASRAEGWRLLVNPDPVAGQGGSVAIAAREALAQDRDLLLLLADMPLVAPDHLRLLVDCDTSAATGYPDGSNGVPVCLRDQAVGKLSLLEGDRGAGAILSRLADLKRVEAAPDTLFDVDDAEGLAKVRSILTAR